MYAKTITSDLPQFWLVSAEYQTAGLTGATLAVPILQAVLSKAMLPSQCPRGVPETTLAAARFPRSYKKNHDQRPTRIEHITTARITLQAARCKVAVPDSMVYNADL